MKGQVYKMDPLQNNVINFINEVNKQRSLDQSINRIHEDPDMKLRRLNDTKREGVNRCMNSIFGKICCNSIPEVNGRIPYTPDLDKVVADYISRRTNGKDIEFYVKEAIRRNPKNTAVINNVYESVEKIVKDKYMDKTIHPEDITDEDYKFEITPDIDDKLVAVIRDNNLDDLAEVIKNNVRDTAVAEVELAKKEKEDRKALEDELTNDETITTESALEDALRERGYGKDTTIYTPSLFESVMIHMFNEFAFDEPIGDVNYIGESCYYQEGVIDKIKNKFKVKAASDAKETMSKLAPQFGATMEELYKTLYSEYRSKISPFNVTKMTKMAKSILNSPSVGDIKMTSKVNPAEVKEAATKYREDMKKLMEEKNVVKFNIPRNTKTYTGTEAVSELVSVIKALDIYFAKPDVKAFVNKTASYVAVKANKCDNPKDVTSVYALANEYYVAELAYYCTSIEFAVDAIAFIKDLIAKNDHAEVKEAAFDAAIREYTLLNLSKALYLESFSIQDVDSLALKYAK